MQKGGLLMRSFSFGHIHSAAAGCFCLPVGEARLFLAYAPSAFQLHRLSREHEHIRSSLAVGDTVCRRRLS